MTPERWKRIDALVQGALQRPVDERGAFVAAECGDDAALRDEVLSLVRADAGASGFLATPAREPGPSQRVDLPAGMNLGSYEILGRLGSGGMGDVYRARDTRLGREAAIKVLAPHLAQDPTGLARFEREARMASALNHPHIVHIYEIGEAATAGGVVRFIAMERVEGETLRARLKAGADWRGLVEPMAQVADALAKAHKAGIVHRDLKPENVILTPEGYPKVLDFGLAKLVERVHVTEAPTATLEEATRSGMIVGTPGYMSPEQVQGKALDHRSDIFSFGAMLFEVVTGRRPFRGDSSIATLHAIVYEEPAEVASLAPAAPAALCALVRRCLSKDPARRYSDAQEIAQELRALARDIRAGTTQVRAAKAAGPPAAAALVALLAVVGSGAWWLSRRVAPPPPTPASGGPKIDRITNRGDAGFPAWSPDGRRIAYLTSEGPTLDGAYTLWVQDLGGGSATRAAGPFVGEFEAPAFAPDGRSLLVQVLDWNPGAAHGELRLYRASIDGGEPQLVLTERDAEQSRLSPDATWIAVARDDRERATTLLSLVDGRRIALDASLAAWARDSRRFLALRLQESVPVLLAGTVDGGPLRELARLPAGDHLGALFWRPDEKAAVYAVWKGKTNVLYAVDLGTNEVSHLGDQSWPGLRNLAWLPDGSGLVLEAEGEPLWRIDYPGGQRHLIATGVANLSEASLSPDGSQLAATRRSIRSEVVVGSGGNASAFETILTGVDVRHDVCWTPDGRLIVSSNEAGSYDLYEMDVHGKHARRLTTDDKFDETEPAAAPDGRYLVFVSNRAGPPSLFRIDRDGGGLRALTTLPKGRGDRAPELSADSRTVYFRRFDNGPTLWAVSIEGGAPRLVVGDRSLPFGTPGGRHESAFGATVSPDGRSLAFFSFSMDVQKGGFSPTRIAIADLAGRIRRSFPLPSALASGYGDRERAQWSADGHAVYFRGREVPGNLWRQPAEGGPPTKITDFMQGIDDYDWSRDGRLLACSRSTQQLDIVVIRDFR
ncbi:MAG TPA: protein kinase [Vicinamibacteria bacterium]|nr:protein kinase [Vicinamibacteria bacterium]